MKLITPFNTEFQCAKAVKGEDFIKLYDDNDIEIAHFGGISDFTGYVISGGEWSDITEEPTELDRINARIDYLAILGGHYELL